MLRPFALLGLGLACCLTLAAAPVCTSGATLASYEALGSGGCTIGPLTVRDFVFSVLSATGGAVPITDSDITVDTTVATNLFGVKFASTGFSLSGAGSLQYLIAYTWDPTADMRSASDILDPGLVDIVTDGCVGAAFIGTSCAGTPISLHVFQGAVSQLTDSVSFSPTPLLGIRHTISLLPSGDTAAFNSIENDVITTPEPGAALLAGAVLAAFALRRRLAKAR